MRLPAAVVASLLLTTFAPLAAGAAEPSSPAANAGAAAAAKTAAQDEGTSKTERSPEKRIAFVVGDGAYAAGPLPTAANDAGLVAQTLQADGFEVIGARDLDGETLRQSYADFLKRLADAGPDTVAFVYLSGYGLQYGDSNYYVPIGAAVTGAIDIPVQSVRLADLLEPLAALPLRARFTVFDAAYAAPFKVEGVTVGGFALVDARPGSLIAFNAAPGTVAPAGKGNFGTYALALAGTMREPGLSPEQLFERVRLRVSADSDGAEVPWDASRVGEDFRFFEDAKGQAGKAVAPTDAGTAKTSSARELPISLAYSAAVAADTAEAYAAFAERYPDDPLAKRSRLMLAIRSEASAWHRAVQAGSPAAFRDYLDRYAGGAHAPLARRHLAEMSASSTPSTQSAGAATDGATPGEGTAVDLAAVADLPPVPWPSAELLPPLPGGFVDPAAPPSPGGLFQLPVPAFVRLPADVAPPAGVAYPAANPFFGSSLGSGVPFGSNVFIGNPMVVNRTHGGNAAAASGEAGGASGKPDALGVALPAAAAQREAALEHIGVETPAQLAQARRRPGGVAIALARPDAGSLPFSHAALASADPGEKTILTGRSSRTDGEARTPAVAALHPPADEAPEAPQAMPVARPQGLGARPPAVDRAAKRERVPAARPPQTPRPEIALRAPAGRDARGREPAKGDARRQVLASRETGDPATRDEGAGERARRGQAVRDRSPRAPVASLPRGPGGDRRGPAVPDGRQLASREVRPPATDARGVPEGLRRGGFGFAGRGGPRGFAEVPPEFARGPRFRMFAGGPRPGPFARGPRFAPFPGGPRPVPVEGGPRPGGFDGGGYGGGFGSRFGGGFAGDF